VNPAVPNFSFSIVPNTYTYGNVDFAVPTPSSDSSGVFQYSSLNTNVATIINGNMVHITGAGTADISATQLSTTNHLSKTIIGNLIVNQAVPTITFTIPSKTYGNVDFAVPTPSSDSTGAFQYSSLNTNVATIINGNMVHITGAGTADISATQLSSTNYLSRIIIGNLLVNQAIPNFSFSIVPNTYIYGNDDLSIPTPISDSSGAFQYASLNPSVATIINGNMVHITGAGTANISATQLSTTNHLSRTLFGNLTVIPAVPTLTFTIEPKTYEDISFTITKPVSDSSGAFSYSSANKQVATISGDIVFIIGFGITDISATQDATTNYTSNTISTTFIVNKNNAKLREFSIPSRTCGDSPFAITAPKTNSPGTITYTSSNTQVATVSGDMITILIAGTTDISASQPETDNHAAGSISATLIVYKFTTILSNFIIENANSKIYSDVSFTLNNPSSNRPGPFIYTSSNLECITISGNTAFIVGAGEADISSNQFETDVYTYGTIKTSVKVNQANTILSNFSIENKTYGRDISFVIAPPSSNRTGIFKYASSNTNIATISGDVITVVGTGSTDISATQLETNNYYSKSISTTLTVSKGTPNLRQFELPTPTYGDVSFNITAPLSDSSGNITYSSFDSQVISISGNVATITGAGTTLITARQDATDLYNSGTIGATIAVNKANTVLSNFTIPDKTYGNSSFNATDPSSNRAGAFVYSISNTNVAYIVDVKNINIRGAGLTEVIATQTETANYTPQSISTNFVVMKAAPNLRNFLPITKYYGIPPFRINNPTTNSPGDITFTSSDEQIVSISENTFTIEDIGVIDISATQAETDNYVSQTISTTLTVMKGYPNLRDFARIVKYFGDAPFEITAPNTNSSGLITFTNSNSQVASIAGNVITIVGVGSSTIIAKQESTPKYISESITATLIVNKTTTVLSDFSIAHKIYGDDPFDLRDPVSNRILPYPFSFTSSNPAVAVISGRTVSIIGAGTTQISAIQVDTTTYSEGIITVDFIVNKKSTTLSNFTIESKQYGDDPFEIMDPSSTRIGTFVYTSSNTEVLTISGSTATIVGAGTVDISATQIATSDYEAGYITTTVYVSKDDTTLSHFILPYKRYGDNSFIITDPSSNRAGSFVYTSSNLQVLTISGNIATIIHPGTTDISAIQLESNNYFYGSITTPFTVHRGITVLSQFSIEPVYFGDKPFALIEPLSNRTGTFVYTSTNTDVATISGDILTIVGVGSILIAATQVETPLYESNTTTATLVSKYYISACNLCKVVPIDIKYQSTTQRFSEYLRTNKPHKIFQGQPTNLRITTASFTTARVLFFYIGLPTEYEIIARTGDHYRTYRISHTQFVQQGYALIVGLTPNTYYTVNVIAYYVNGDSFAVNHMKTFHTTLAQGAVYDLSLFNPTDRIYSIYNTPYYTSFDICFTPLRDKVDYRIEIPSLRRIIDISYEDISHSLPYCVADVSFNTPYDVLVKTIYGEGDDTYIYSTTGNITTWNESYLSFLDISFIRNTSVDLSYSQIDASNIYYKLYFEDQPIEYHHDYRALFSISPLTIGKHYGNTYLSTVYISSKNEYRNVIRELSFNTLNESPSGFLKSLVKNTSIDISFIDASGSFDTYTFSIVPSIPPYNVDICMNSHMVVFKDLSINTTYDITIETEYPPVYTDICNTYIVSQTFHTLNQSSVQNIQHTIIPGTLSTVIIEFAAAADFPNVEGANYRVDLSGMIQTLSNKTTRAVYRNVEVGSYTYTVASYYPATSRYGENYYVSSEKTLSIYNFVKSSVNVQCIPIGTSVLFIKDDNTNHDLYDISISAVAVSNDSTVRIANIRNGIDWNTEYRVSNLENNTEYNYTILAKYNEDNNTKTYNTSGTFRTILEDEAVIHKLIVRNTSADLSWSSIGSMDVSYLLHFRNQTAQYSNSQTMQTFQDLSINETYDISLTVVYNRTNNRYSKNISFTTLDEEPAIVSQDVLYNHPLYGNLIILRFENRNASDISVNKIYWNDEAVYTSIDDFHIDIRDFQFYENYYGNVHTIYSRNHANRLQTGQGQDYIEYERKEYITDFSFESVMVKPISTIHNTSVQLNWMPLLNTESISDVDVSYSIHIQNEDQSYDGTYTWNSPYPYQYTIEDLSVNTIYNISFTRDYGTYDKTEHFAIETLNENAILNIENSIALNSGLYGNVVVLDISNINPQDVSENIINIRSTNNDIVQTYRSEYNMVDLDVSYGNTYTGNICTIYKPTPSPNVYQIYASQPYISYDFSFTVGPMVNTTTLQNGTFDSYTNTEYTFEPTTGILRDVPPFWNGNSVIVADNSNGTLIGYKYLEDHTIKQHVLLYTNNQARQFANLSQTMESTYLFKNNYKLSFYVANQYNTLSTVEYQVQFLNPQGIVYETNPIVSKDSSWNKLEVRFIIPKSYKDVSFRIRRNIFEPNNLFISDVSLVPLNEEFEVEPRLSIYPAQWELPVATAMHRWRDMYDSDSISKGNVITLSTNMSFDFWIYIHDEDRNEKGVFVIGETLKTGFPSIYLWNKQLIIEHRLHYYEKIHRIEFPCKTKIPIHYQLVYHYNTITVYENGQIISITKPFSYVEEADPNSSIILGTPGNSDAKGYILSNIHIYHFPLKPNQCFNRYEFFKPRYSNIGNYSTLEPYSIHELTPIYDIYDASYYIYYQLHNGKYLRKNIKLATMKNQIVDYSLNTLPIPFTISFWIQDADNNRIISIYNSNVPNPANNVLFAIDLNRNNISIGNVKLQLGLDTDALEHVSCVVDISNTYVYKNGYLYDSSMSMVEINASALTPTLTPASIIFDQVLLGNSGKIGDLQIFNKALTQEEVYTSYLHYYRSDVLYNISGVYRIIIYNVEGSDISNIRYKIKEKPDHITSISIPESGVLYFNNNNTEYGSAIYIDLSMNPFDLNNFNKMSEQIIISIEDYQLDIVISGSGNPYIQTHNVYNEGENMLVSLVNTNYITPYRYFINGYNIDSKDISGGDLSGNIMQYKNINIRADYKDEGVETFVYSIPALGLSRYIDISDTTRNVLRVDGDKVRVRNNDTFTVLFTWPENGSLPNVIHYTIYGNEYVIPNMNGRGSFTKNGDNNTAMVVFTVKPMNDPQKQFILTLDDYDSSILLIINDFDSPRIMFRDANYNSITSANELDTVMVSLEVPIYWASDTSFNYKIEGVNKFDITSSSDMYFDTNTMTGKFVLNGTTADISFVISGNNSFMEGNETMNVKLTDVSYTDIANRITIIDSVQPYYYNLVIADMNGNTIDHVKEGESFQVKLNTNDVMGDIEYTITGGGIDTNDLSNALIGIFDRNNRTKTFKVKDDLTTEGDERMIFTLLLNVPNNDIIASIIIQDTSESPQYSLTASTGEVRPYPNNSFNLTFLLKNYEFISPDIRSQNLEYNVSINSTSSKELDVSGIKYGTVNFRDVSSYIFNYTLLSDVDTSGNFVFAIAEQSIPIKMNYS
jgi:hypothetical protein